MKSGGTTGTSLNLNIKIQNMVQLLWRHISCAAACTV